MRYRTLKATSKMSVNLMQGKSKRKVRKFPYHPANQAVRVEEVGGVTPDTARLSLFSDAHIKQKQQDTRQWRMKPGDKGAKVLGRLAECYKLLPDPLGDLLYSTRTKADHKHSARSTREMVHVVPGCSLLMPQCCLEHRSQVRSLVIQHRKYLYNSPKPAPPKDKPQKRDKIAEMAMKNAAANRQRQYPLSTVCVRWKSAYCYTHYKLYDVMNQFGPIESLEMKSPNSGIVVFTNLSDSCDAVDCKIIGAPKERLHCNWFHKAMTSRCFYGNNNRLRAFNNDFIHPAM